jgi:hypothetical protein
LADIFESSGLNTKTGCPPTPVPACPPSSTVFCVGYLLINKSTSIKKEPIYPVFPSSHTYRRIGFLLSITYCSRNLISIAYHHLDVTFFARRIITILYVIAKLFSAANAQQQITKTGKNRVCKFKRSSTLFPLHPFVPINTTSRQRI